MLVGALLLAIAFLRRDKTVGATLARVRMEASSGGPV